MPTLTSPPILGQGEQAVVHTRQDHGACLWLRAPEVLWDVEAPEGTPHEPRQLVPDVKSCIFLTFVTNTANALWRGNY